MPPEKGGEIEAQLCSRRWRNMDGPVGRNGFFRPFLETQVMAKEKSSGIGRKKGKEIVQRPNMKLPKKNKAPHPNTQLNPPPPARGSCRVKHLINEVLGEEGEVPRIDARLEIRGRGP